MIYRLWVNVWFFQGANKCQKSRKCQNSEFSENGHPKRYTKITKTNKIKMLSTFNHVFWWYLALLRVSPRVLYTSLNRYQRNRLSILFQISTGSMYSGQIYHITFEERQKQRYNVIRFVSICFYTNYWRYENGCINDYMCSCVRVKRKTVFERNENNEDNKKLTIKRINC